MSIACKKRACSGHDTQVVKTGQCYKYEILFCLFQHTKNMEAVICVNLINKLWFSFNSPTGDRTDRDGSDRDRERESIFRIRDRRRLDTTLRDEALKSLERDKVEGFTAEITKKLANPNASPIHFGEDLQYWVEKVGVMQYYVRLLELREFRVISKIKRNEKILRNMYYECLCLVDLSKMLELYTYFIR